MSYCPRCGYYGMCSICGGCWDCGSGCVCANIINYLWRILT